jgi:hypothetical protein
MRATSVLRFVIFGAVGFGIGWAVTGALGLIMPESFFPWTFFFGGAVGGAVLGLALRDWKKLATLSWAGFLGFGAGFYFSMVAGLLLGLLPNIEAGIGVVGGAALGLVFGDRKRVAVLALAGFVGFGIGGAIAEALQTLMVAPRGPEAAGPSQGPSLWLNVSFDAIVGLVGGATLGAALGYLEQRGLVEGQRPRVR